MVTALAILAAGQPATNVEAADITFAYDCRAVIPDGGLHRAAIEIRLPGLARFRTEERQVQVTATSAEDPIFASADLPQTVSATDRPIRADAPGYVQFAISGREANYMVALHESSERALPVYFFVTRSDHSDWHRNWYWASGFCSRQAGNVQ